MFLIILGYTLVLVWYHFGIYKSKVDHEYWIATYVGKLVPYSALGCKMYFDKEHPSKMFLRWSLWKGEKWL